MNDISVKPSARKDTVTEVGFRDISRLMAPGTERRQSMRGFDPDYVDIVDYIIRSTHKIWEEKGVGLIDSHYRHNAVVYTPYGVIEGRETMIAATLQTIAAFPDRRLYGDAVVWSGNDEDGFYSSHRLTTMGTNIGPTQWGPATGRRVVFGAIADCFVFENRVSEEWLVRDDAHIVRQLGFDVDMVARTLAAADIGSAAAPPYPAELSRTLGQIAPERGPAPTDGNAEAFVTWHLEEIWNGRMFNRVRDFYALAATQHAPVGRIHRGHGALAGMPITVLAAIPDGVLTIEHVNHVDEHRGTQVAVRWSLQGNHQGHGLFGAPTGKRVSILGISHFLLREGQVAEEWTLFNELAVLKQIYLQTGV